MLIRERQSGVRKKVTGQVVVEIFLKAAKYWIVEMLGQDVDEDPTVNFTLLYA